MNQAPEIENPTDRSEHDKEVFIFLAAHNFWEGLFENVNMKFLRMLLGFQLTEFPCVLMTIIMPVRLTDDHINILKKKEEKIKKIAHENGVKIEFCYIRGRTNQGLFGAFKEIRRKTFFYKKRFIWASNYFNGFLGAMLKYYMPDSRLHFEMMGLVPEEELFYSESNIVSRIAKFLILRMICRINLKKADSISVVSRRFKDYVISRYRVNPSRIDVIPCFYDDKVFYVDDDMRRRFRRRYQIEDHQKLIVYSGMLQKWQMPDVLFSFFQKMQQQDENRGLRFLVATFDQDKASDYATKYGIRDLIIDSASGIDINGPYNAADIGIATRSADWVSIVSSPVKIPEYLATQNCLILLESIGDYGLDLKSKKYALIKKNKKDLLNTSISEIHLLKKPDKEDMADILNEYSVRKYLPVIRNILDQRFQ